MSVRPIKLIVGLGNPGSQYEKTRHNAGVWFVAALARASDVVLRPQSAFHGLYGRLHSQSQSCHLLVPTTFMNRSGRAVSALAHYYKLLPEEILVVHDELDLMPGIVKLKAGGGAGGHNGLKDIIHGLNSPNFWRLRLGIGHPGARDQVLHYVLGVPNRVDCSQIEDAITKSQATFELLLAGQLQQAMQILHTA